MRQEGEYDGAPGWLTITCLKELLRLFFPCSREPLNFPRFEGAITPNSGDIDFVLAIDARGVERLPSARKNVDVVQTVGGGTPSHGIVLSIGFE